MGTTPCVFVLFCLSHLNLLTRVSLKSNDLVVILSKILFEEEITFQNQTLRIPNPNSIFRPYWETKNKSYINFNEISRRD